MTGTRVRLGITPVTGGTEDVIEVTEELVSATIRVAQTVGDQSGTLRLVDNSGAWMTLNPGDNVRVEAWTRDHPGWNLVLEGYLSRIEQDAGPSRLVSIEIRGLNSVLDLVTITADTEYVDQTWTAIAEDLVSTYLPGYTANVTTDADTVSRVCFDAGMKLRGAMDHVRRGLTQANDEAWEYEVTKDAGTRTFNLYPRGSTVQETFDVDDVYNGAKRMGGDLAEVINRAVVVGATRPTEVQDETGLSESGTVRLDSTSDYVALPFTALDTPLYDVTFVGDRSLIDDPPTLEAIVARNSDNRDILGQGHNVDGPFNRSGQGADATIHDADRTTQVGLTTPNDNTFYEIAAYDFTTAKTVRAILLTTDSPAGAANHTLEVQYSSDDSAWTTLYTETADNLGSPSGITTTVTATSARYWRLRHKRNTASTLSVEEFQLLEWTSTGTGATNEDYVQDLLDSSGATAATTGGSTTTVMAKVDFGAAKPIARVGIRHDSTTATSLINWNIEVSDDDSSWTTIATVDSSSSTVEDVAYPQTTTARYWRVTVTDDRNGGSGSSTHSLYYVDLREHTTTFGEPVAGDELLASSLTWTVADLVSRPGTAVAKAYTSPNLALRSGEKYWLILRPTGSPSATSYWDISYGTTTGATDSLTSTDGGVTWSAIATDAVLRLRLRYNNRPITATVNDTTSQSTYSTVVPNGILSAAVVDEALVTQDMVNAEAEAIIQRRANPTERVSMTVDANLSLVVGSPITITRALANELGTDTLTWDVVAVTHHFDNGNARTRLELGDSDPISSAGDVLRGVASRRTL